MKKLICALVAILICVAGFSLPGWAITITPSKTNANTGEAINFQVASAFLLGTAPPAGCNFYWLFGDEVPIAPQIISPGTCVAASPRFSTCINNFVHTYQDAGTYNYQVYAPCTSIVMPNTVTGSLTVTCPTLSFGSCSGFATACFSPPLPAGDQGKPYSYNLSARAGGGKGTLTYTATSTLPAGLTLSPSGVLSGTPSVNGTFAITARVEDNCTRFAAGKGAFLSPQSVTQTFNLTINPCPAVALTSTSPLPLGTVGSPYSFTFSGTGQAPVSFQAPPPVSCTFSPCPPSGTYTPPPGLTWNGRTGTLSGTPTAAGNYSIYLAAVDSCQPVQVSWPLTYTLSIQCQFLSITSPGIIRDATVGQYYSYQVSAPGGQPPTAYDLAGGSLPPGMGMNSSGVISGTPSAAGHYTFGVQATDSCSVRPQSIQKTLALDVNCVPLSIATPASLSAGAVGQAYSAQILTAGGQSPTSFSLTSGTLPPGLTFSASGLLTGTPTTEGKYRFTINAQDSCALVNQSIQKVFMMDVAAVLPPCPALSILSPSSLPDATSGQAYSVQLQAAGGTSPIIFSIAGGVPPPGVALTQTGLLTGMPTAPGNYSFVVSATDSCPSGARTVQQTYTILVQAPPTVCAKLNVISQSPLPNGKVSQAYTYQLVSTGGQPPVTFRIVGGSLPQGLNLTPSGLITGLPAVAGNYSVTIRVEDSCPGGAQAFQSVFAILISALPPPNTFVVAASPASLAVPRGLSSAGAITYNLTGDPSLSGALISAVGNFMVGAEVVDTNPTSVTAMMTNGSAVVTEQIVVPVTVIERALQRGSTRITYQRDFLGQGGATATAIVSINVTTEAAAEFGIKRINLYFTDQRPEITVPRLSKDLRAFAEIHYTGSGPLEGYWEVDGRVIGFVSRPVTFGQTLVLESPAPPTLPTVDTGVHLMRFIVTSPQTDLPMPVISYFVTPEEAVRRVFVKLMTPADKAPLEYAPRKFAWESSSPGAAYQVLFYARAEKEPVFSAFVREQSYQLAEQVLKGRFSAGQTYLWKVQAIDDTGAVIGESQKREFTFEAPQAYVPGQILVAVEAKAYSEGLVGELGDRYRLKALEAFDLKSILLKLMVFESSEKDIFRVIAEMKKDSRILMVQPNYVMRTFAAAAKVPQYADTVMRLGKISPTLKGRGVKIALIDTGVDSAHADLKGRISASRNFVSSEGYKAEIHGTAVAGIIAGGGLGVKGIAPEAEVLALRACRQALDEAPEAECFTTSLSRAIDDAIRSDAKVINMSFGAAQNDPLLAKLIAAGAERDMIFVAPAGNAAGERELRFPASHPSVVAVGGFDERNRPYPNSDIVKKATVSAPAVDVFTTIPGGRYNFLTGTSLSSGYISGLIALATERDRTLTKGKLPVYHGDFCRWEEDLLQISLCGK